jgi:hypothetical protein
MAFVCASSMPLEVVDVEVSFWDRGFGHCPRSETKARVETSGHSTPH